jgi:hypothetical protein
MSALSDRHPKHESHIRQEMQVDDAGAVVGLAWRLICYCGYEGPSRERSDLASRDEEQHHLEAWIDHAESA